MLLMILLSLALQVEPRFTMPPRPDDTIRAEFFEISGDAADRNRTLLGDAVVQDESVEEVPGLGPLRLIRARRADGGLVALFDAPGHPTLGDKVCRIANDLPGTINNAPRAVQWCRSFYLPPTALPTPAVPAPAGG